MKLIFKITILYLLISSLVFVLGGLITFEVIKREVNYEEQRFLKERLESVIRMIERRDLNKPFTRDKISIIPLDQIKEETAVVFSDTVVMHSTLQRTEPHLKLDVIKNVNGRSYKISMFDLIVEEDDIAEGVQESLLKMYLILTAVVLVLSAVTSYYLLKPFNTTLQQIKNFSLKRSNKIKLDSSTTSEFHKLNSFLEDMMNKMKTDYQAMKEFTENAAHEMQTPLSIANGKLEVLLDAENLTEEQSAMIVSAQTSIQRLSKLNKALALLTRIDNKEFEEKTKINLSAELEQQLFAFTELLELKSIKLNKNIESNVKINMDMMLCSILLTNLLQNAIRHNYENGEIIISLTPDKLLIANTGDPLKVDPLSLFDRFKKDNQNIDSLGLGLSIVKKICDVNGFSINYTFSDQRHQLEITF